jgi:hypothetical protein
MVNHPKPRYLRRKANRSTTPAGFERDRHPRRGAAVPIDDPTLLTSLSFLSTSRPLSNTSFETRERAFARQIGNIQSLPSSPGPDVISRHEYRAPPVWQVEEEGRGPGQCCYAPQRI